MATTTAETSTTAPDPTYPSSSTPSTQVQPDTCAQCLKSPSPEDATAKPLKQCLKCHSASYCDKDCQKAHFKTHKKVCARLAQEYASTHEPKMASRAPAKTGERGRGLQKWQFDT